MVIDTLSFPAPAGGLMWSSWNERSLRFRMFGTSPTTGVFIEIFASPPSADALRKIVYSSFLFSSGRIGSCSGGLSVASSFGKLIESWPSCGIGWNVRMKKLRSWNDMSSMGTIGTLMSTGASSFRRRKGPSLALFHERAELQLSEAGLLDGPHGLVNMAKPGVAVRPNDDRHFFLCLGLAQRMVAGELLHVELDLLRRQQRFLERDNDAAGPVHVQEGDVGVLGRERFRLARDGQLDLVAQVFHHEGGDEHEEHNQL